MTTKVCTTCKQEKSTDDFYGKIKGGFQTYCKVCANARRAQWARDNTNKTRAYRLKYKYGLTDELITTLLNKQKNACAICAREFDTNVAMHIDHNHSCCGGEKACSNCVRGILCQRCNIKLAAYEDTLQMENSLKYLQKYAPIV